MIAPSNDATCAQCGYSLGGLPQSGRCPECGLSFGPEVLVLWGKGGLQIRSRSGLPRQVQHAIAAAWTLAAVLMAIAFPLKTLPFFGVIIAWMWWQQWQLWMGRNGWQVRISNESYGTRPGPGKVRFHRWKGDEEIDFLRKKGGIYQFTIRDNLNVPCRIEMDCTEAEAERWRSRIESLLNRHVGLEK